MQKGKIVVITGGLQGLGRAISETLAASGANVYSLNLRANAELDNVEQYREGFITNMLCDVRDIDQIKNRAREIVAIENKIDVLINNAAVWLEGDLKEASADEIRNVIDTNLIGAILVTQVFTPYLKISTSASILNISSTAGIEPGKDWAVYSASKFGLRGFTDSLKLAMEGTGIKVMGFYPGGMNTELYENAGVQKYSKEESWMMKKEDIAEIVIFILSRPADLIIDHIEIRKFYK